jgi:amidase
MSYTRRGVLLQLVNAGRKSTDPSTEPIFMSATKLAQWIREKKISSLDAVKACQSRVAAVNPKLNAVVELCTERALVEARQADAARAKGQIKGPLHGVPMTIKDSFDTEGVVSTGGTLGRKTYIPGRDATVVARLREAGAILMGKTNTPELTLSFVTQNLIHGQTRNPYSLDHQPSGSSGGAAAIVAAGGAPFDVGSDYAGSIRAPAHACGIAGLKSTAGRVLRTGHIVGYGGPFDSWQQIGPLARRVEDLHLLLTIIAGPDHVDAAIEPVPLQDPARVNLKELRVAWYATSGEPHPIPEIQRAVKNAASIMRTAGAQVSEAMPPHLRDVTDLRMKMSQADAGSTVRRMLDRYGTRQTSLRPGGQARPANDFAQMVEQLDQYRSAMLAFLENFDLIVCPVQPFAGLPLDAPNTSGSMPYTNPYNITGWPAAVVRAGTAPLGLPIGVQIVGRPWTEHVVLAAAAYIESQTGGWQKPAL